MGDAYGVAAGLDVPDGEGDSWLDRCDVSDDDGLGLGDDGLAVDGLDVDRLDVDGVAGVGEGLVGRCAGDGLGEEAGLAADEAGSVGAGCGRTSR